MGKLLFGENMKFRFKFPFFTVSNRIKNTVMLYIYLHIKVSNNGKSHIHISYVNFIIIDRDNKNTFVKGNKGYRLPDIKQVMKI